MGKIAQKQKGARPDASHHHRAHAPGAKYFKSRVHSSIDGPKIASIVVWDGIKDYTNAPPIPGIVIAENFEAETLTIIEVPDDWERGERRFQLGIEASHEGSDVIFFAKSHLTYCQLCRAIEAICGGRLQ